MSLEIIAAQSQQTRFLRITKHEMTAHISERIICYYCPLAANHGNHMRGLLKKGKIPSLSA
jgi:hypothetical protein